MNEKNILDFIAEAGALKRLKRSGWPLVGVPLSESVADHSFRCAVLGYMLAKMEGAQPYKVLFMTLFNDVHEARIGDPHKISHRYMDVKKAESKAFKEQIEKLPGAMKNEMRDLRGEYEAQKTPESVIARDADILECLIQAKEYLDGGFTGVKGFFRTGPKHLRTKSARQLWTRLRSWDANGWWQGLGKFER